MQVIINSFKYTLYPAVGLFMSSVITDRNAIKVNKYVVQGC